MLHPLVSPRGCYNTQRYIHLSSICATILSEHTPGGGDWGVRTISVASGKKASVHSGQGAGQSQENHQQLFTLPVNFNLFCLSTVSERTRREPTQKKGEHANTEHTENIKSHEIKFWKVLAARHEIDESHFGDFFVVVKHLLNNRCILNVGHFNYILISEFTTAGENIRLCL